MLIKFIINEHTLSILGILALLIHQFLQRLLFLKCKIFILKDIPDSLRHPLLLPLYFLILFPQLLVHNAFRLFTVSLSVLGA